MAAEKEVGRKKKREQKLRPGCCRESVESLIIVSTSYSLVVNGKLFILDWSICLNMGMENWYMPWNFFPFSPFLISSQMMHWLLREPICRKFPKVVTGTRITDSLVIVSPPPSLIRFIPYPVFCSGLYLHLFHLQQFIVLILLSESPVDSFSKRMKSLPPPPPLQTKTILWQARGNVPSLWLDIPSQQNSI